MSFFYYKKFNERRYGMKKKKVDKKTIIIVMILLVVTIISVFAVNGMLQANESISPYRYRMVVAYFGYWNAHGDYLADLQEANGNVKRINMNPNPGTYLVEGHTFPVALLPGNYAIEDIMNYSEYKASGGSWGELNYSGLRQEIVEKFYMSSAYITNKNALIGKSNTEVKFTANFYPLPPDQAEDLTNNRWRCYVAIVIKYKDLDYVYKYDGYEVLYKEAGSNREVKSQKPMKSFGAARTVTENPETVNGYTYNGNYKIEKTDVEGNISTIKNASGNSATVNLGQTSSEYTITFYYTKDTGGGTDPDPGEGDKMVYVWYKDKEKGENLASLKKVKTSMGKKVIESAVKVDGYKCTDVTINGKTTKNLSQTSINETFGSGDYMTPPDNYLVEVTFNYEKSNDKPSDNWCDPEFDAYSQDKTIKMKRKDFDNAQDLYFDNIHINLKNFKGGKKRISGTEWKDIPGQHGFEYFDLYLKYPGATGYDFIVNDIFNTYVYQYLTIPKSKFVSLNSENTLYGADIEATIGAFCICGGFNAEKTYFSLYVEIEENKPPEAYYKYATLKRLPDDSVMRVYGKAYVNKDINIQNYCSDPNGLTDIRFIKYIFKNNSGQVKNITLNMTSWKQYILNKIDNFNDTSIEFINFEENGSLNLKFMNTDEWEVTIYVEDTEGLNDSYTEKIKPEILSLKPTAVIRDTYSYRYPYVSSEYSGKQNRTIKLDSNNSYTAEWLRDLNVSIDHNKDMWRIEPIDGQNVDSVKFERDINKIVSGNIINARYEHLDIKMIFKEPGQYKVRLQVTDTEGNISDWAEQVVVIHSDIHPDVTGVIGSKYYRNSAGVVTIYLSSLNASSIDNDSAIIYYVGYKYDSNNNNNFEDEVLKEIEYRNPVTLQTSNLGKYQFVVKAKEEFGQETLHQYITEEDKQKASITFFTEVDNIAPNVNKFKIMRVEE